MLRFILNLLISIWLGFLTAAAFEIHRPAILTGIPGPVTVNDPAPADMLEQIEQSVWHRTTPLELNAAEVNRYLSSVLAAHQSPPSGLVTRFDRVALDFMPGSCRIQFSWITHGWHSTASLDFTVSRDKDEFVIVPVGGRYGRLPVFRGALAAMIPACRSLGTALDGEIRAILQMNQIRFEKNKVVLDPRINANK